MSDALIVNDKAKKKIIDMLTNNRGVSDVGFSIFADTDADADFAF